jgi:hypothetical protein
MKGTKTLTLATSLFALQYKVLAFDAAALP